MRPALASLLVLALLGAVAVTHADPLPGFFNTGVDPAGAVLATGAVDPHFVLVASADGGHPGPAARVCAPIPAGYWKPNDGVSRWIAPAVDENWPALGTAHPAGDYVYRFTFDLTGYDHASVVVSGAWGVDNSGAMKLNGSPVGSTITNYNPLVPFSLTSGFVAGANTLDFVITNWSAGGSNPTGLRVEGLTGSANPVVSVLERGTLPGLVLSAPVPNPARDRVELAMTLPRAGAARLVIRDLAGREVRVLVSGVFPAGGSHWGWNGEDERGGRCGPGVYFADLESQGARVTRRFAWIR